MNLMPMPAEMKAKMRAFTAEISKQIQDINGDPANTKDDIKRKIEGLKGAPKEDMMDFLNKNFRQGPGLLLDIALSEGRPRGGIVEKIKGALS